MENNTICDTHPLSDTLEEYLFGRLPEPETAALEEHLLICERCCHEVEKTEEFIRLMKQAALEFTGTHPRPTFSFRWAPISALVGAGLVTAALAIAIPHRPAPAIPVQLISLRGGSDAIASHVRAGSALDLTLDSTDLGDSHGIRLEIVDSLGSKVWNGPTQPSSSTKLAAQVPKSLRAGAYFVRLYSPGGELLREFVLIAD